MGFYIAVVVVAVPHQFVVHWHPIPIAVVLVLVVCVLMVVVVCNYFVVLMVQRSVLLVAVGSVLDAEVGVHGTVECLHLPSTELVLLVHRILVLVELGRPTFVGKQVVGIVKYCRLCMGSVLLVVDTAVVVNNYCKSLFSSFYLAKEHFPLF